MIIQTGAFKSPYYSLCALYHYTTISFSELKVWVITLSTGNAGAKQEAGKTTHFTHLLSICTLSQVYSNFRSRKGQNLWVSFSTQNRWLKSTVSVRYVVLQKHDKTSLEWYTTVDAHLQHSLIDAWGCCCTNHIKFRILLTDLFFHCGCYIDSIVSKDVIVESLKCVFFFFAPVYLMKIQKMLRFLINIAAHTYSSYFIYLYLISQTLKLQNKFLFPRRFMPIVVHVATGQNRFESFHVKIITKRWVVARPSVSGVRACSEFTFLPEKIIVHIHMDPKIVTQPNELRRIIECTVANLILKQKHFFLYQIMRHDFWLHDF